MLDKTISQAVNMNMKIYVKSVMLSLVAVFVVMEQTFANENVVERISYDSESGNFVDKWTIPAGNYQTLPNSFVLTAGSDATSVACHGLIDGINHIWTDSSVVITSGGQSVPLGKDERLTVESNGVDYVVEAHEGLCDGIVALYAGAAGTAGIGSSTILIGAGAIAVVAAIASSDNDNNDSSEELPVQPPAPVVPPVEPPLERFTVNDNRFRLPLAITAPRTGIRTLRGTTSGNDQIPAGTIYTLVSPPTRLGAGTFQFNPSGSFIYSTTSCSGIGTDSFVADVTTPDGRVLRQTVIIEHTGALVPASPIC